MIYESRIILTATTTARVKSMKKKKKISYTVARGTLVLRMLTIMEIKTVIVINLFPSSAKLVDPPEIANIDFLTGR